MSVKPEDLYPEQPNPGDEFQVQISRIADVWLPMKPDGPIHGMAQGGDHWFTDYYEARVAATHLRNGLTWSAVRIVHRSPDGTITREQDVL